MISNADKSHPLPEALDTLEGQTSRLISLVQATESLALKAVSGYFGADQALRMQLAKQPRTWRPKWLRNKNLQLLEKTPLFDPVYYLALHPEAIASGMTPHEHYLKVGGRNQWDTHPLFSTSWYLETNRDIALSGMNPLIHYLKFGAKEGRSPHPLFDTQLYLSDHPEVATSGMNPLEHYILLGGKAGYRPHWLFDGAEYLTAHPEVYHIGIDPLSHYLRFGHLQHYAPHWSFDQRYYLAQSSEIARLNTVPLLHFITRGVKQRLNPNPAFDIAAYIERHPFLANEGAENPLIHFVRGHAAPSALPVPSMQSESAPPAPAHTEQETIAAQPLQSFMDFLYDEFGVDIRTSIVERMRRFRLPFTGEKIIPNPLTQEIDEWVTEIAALSNTVCVTDRPDVSIIIPAYNQLPFTLACIHSVLSDPSRFSYEIIVADDRSTDRTSEIFASGTGRIRHILTPHNQGFIRNCNNAAKHARGRYLVLLNNDTFVLPGWLDELIAPLAEDSSIGLTGSKLLYPDGRLQEAGGLIFSDGSGWNYGRTDDPRKPEYCFMRDADYVSGASIAVRADYWHETHGFDERYQVAYYEDTDLAFRVRASGLRVVIQPMSRLLHFEGISSGTDISSGAKQYQVVNAEIFREKWRDVLPSHGSCDPQNLPTNRAAHGRILVIDACTPTPDRDSGSMDTFQFLRIFKSFGLHVTFAPENLAHFGNYTSDLQRIGVETLYAPYWMSLEDVLKQRGHTFDLVLIYRAPIADRLIDLVRAHAPQARIIFDTVDLHFLREEREAALNNAPEKVQRAAATRKMELKAIERSDATIILSNHEMGIVQALLPQAKLYEIPIVREIPGKGPLGYHQRKDIVFIGGFRHAPNLDAVKWFVAEVWPHLRARGFPDNFHIVGSDMPDEITALHGSGVIVRGHVPDIADVFNRVRLSIAPLRYGAGLKGKVISSLSHGVPVVATSVAVEGGGFTHEQNVLVADEPDEVADAIMRLYDGPTLWEQLSSGGLAHCQDSFSVSVVSDRIRHLMNSASPNLTLKYGMQNVS